MDYNDMFEYRDGNLYNKTHRGYQSPIGAITGTVNNKGYLHTKIKGKGLKIHRIIWEMHNGAIPKDLVIDHINENKLDNRIENLQLLTNKQNISRSNKAKPSVWRNKYKIKRNGFYLGLFKTLGGAMMEYNTYYLKRGYEN
jgi:hypothetical protein